MTPHSLVDLGGVRVHLLDDGGELGDQLLVGVQGLQVLLPQEEALVEASCCL